MILIKVNLSFAVRGNIATYRRTVANTDKVIKVSKDLRLLPSLASDLNIIQIV